MTGFSVRTKIGRKVCRFNDILSAGLSEVTESEVRYGWIGVGRVRVRQCLRLCWPLVAEGAVEFSDV